MKQIIFIFTLLSITTTIFATKHKVLIKEDTKITIPLVQL